MLWDTDFTSLVLMSDRVFWMGGGENRAGSSYRAGGAGGLSRPKPWDFEK